MGDEFLESSTENFILRMKIGDTDEKRLDETRTEQI